MVPLLAGLAGLVAGAALWLWLGPRAPDAGARCVTVTMPADVVVQGATLSRDGSTLLVVGQPRVPAGTASPPPRIYARRLDRYDFKEVAGTEGATGLHMLSDETTLYVYMPVAPGSPQFRLAKLPYDGSAPATTVVELKNSWSGLVPMLEGGDLLTREGQDKLLRLGPDGKVSAPIKLDAGRPGVSSYALGRVLPGDRAMLVAVISYDARGWHYSVGVLDIRSGKVKVVEEDGGNPRYSPTGHLLFSRGDALLAVPFDLGRLEPRGTPVAVWSGLSTQFSFVPGFFDLTRDGSLFYRPGQVGGERSLAVLETSGKLVPWSSDRRAMDNRPEISPDGRRFVCTLASNRGIDEIWISDLATPSFQRIGTGPDADAAFYVWSPDGARIAYFRSGKDGRDGIYVHAVDGGESSLILKRDDYVPLGWLPDGASLLVFRRGAEKSSLALLKLAGDAADTTRLHPIMNEAPNLFAVRLSPDGRHLAYTSDESGTPSAYVVELRPDGSTGRPVQVQTDQAFELQWATNGSALYIRDQRDRIMKAAMPSASALAMPAAVEVCDLDQLGISLWTVLPDGRLFVGMKNDNESDVTQYSLVLNWTAELKRKMSGVR
jgi:dipeptidyl aminopeptidase/acylaminoacyl peptidase